MNMPANISDFTVAVVPPNMVNMVWDKVEPIINRVVERAPDDTDLVKTYNRLNLGEHLLVIVSSGTEITAALTLDIKTTDSGVKYLYLPIVAGDDFDGWYEQFIEVARNIARDYGCEKIRGTGRQGWARKLKQHGWKPVFQTVELEV